ncbi:unnamed protein product [Prunus armeniaca]|uniref:T-complex protein 1 subunit theta n=1 Tax=Prunus armeniaca TaxID=36596 RepID=A0A6J5TMT3_PRUAR|nr:unnamed protein product [Prunus armeniaca]
MGLHPSENINGCNKAIKKNSSVLIIYFLVGIFLTIEILDELVEPGSENMDVCNKEEVVSRMKAAVASKQFGQEHILSSLVADACIQVCPKNPANFNVDNVCVAKIVGGGLHNCTVVRGMVLKIDVVGSIKRMEKAKVAVFASGVDTSATETKGTVLIHTADQVTVVKNEEGDDLERAVDDGVNTYKMSKTLELISYCRNAFHFHAMCKDSRIVPGEAATEIELAKRVKEFSFTETGSAIAKFSESFEMVPKTLAENVGLNAMEIISSLYVEHAPGNTKFGLDLEEGSCKDVSTLNIWDLHITKFFALKYAADAACTVLRVDQYPNLV